MKTFLRRSLLAAVVLAGLLVVAAVVIPRFVDADRWRPEVEEQLTHVLGRRVVLGPLSLSLGWGVGLRAESLEVGPPIDPAAGPGPTAGAHDVRLRVAIRPLFSGDVDVRSISFRDGTVRQDSTTLASGLALRASLRREHGGTLESQGVLRGRLDSLGGAQVDLRFDTRVDGDRLDLRSLSGPVGPGRISAKGAVTGIETGDFRATAEAEAEFGRTSATGTVEATLRPSETRVEFAVRTPFVDFDELAAMAGVVPPAVAPRASGGLFPAAFAAETRVGPAPAVPIRADGTIEAERGRFHGLDLTAIRSRVSYRDGRIRFERADFELYGGRHEGTLSVETERPEVPFHLDDRVTGVRLDELLSAFAPQLPKTVYGTAELELDVRGRAGTDAPDATVVGDGRLEVKDGRLAGAGLAEQLSAILAEAGNADAKRGETPFERLGASFTVRDRRAHTDDLEFRSEDLDLDGNGDLRFDGGLDLDVVASLSPRLTAQALERLPQLKFRVGRDGRMTLPVQVRGDLSRPQVVLDLQRILEEGLGDRIREGLRSLFGKKH